MNLTLMDDVNTTLAALNDTVAIATNNTTPYALLFNNTNLAKIICNAIFFVFSFCGNVPLFFILLHNLSRKPNRVQKLILHMNIADLIVTFVAIPSQISLAATVQFIGPNWLCKVVRFMDCFCVYLGSNILILITLDRFCCIMLPMYPIRANRNVCTALWIAWAIALFAAAPQLYLFETSAHPAYPWFWGCVTLTMARWGKPNTTQAQIDGFRQLVTTNTVLNGCMTYVAPFLVIVFCYSAIFLQMGLNRYRHRQELRDDPSLANGGTHCNGSARNRRNADGDTSKSGGQSNTFHMTAAMVAIFLVCWTPYFLATMIHFTKVAKLPGVINTILFQLATFNSVANPYLYFYFSINVRRELAELLASVGVWKVPRRRRRRRRSSASSSPSLQGAGEDDDDRDCNGHMPQHLLMVNMGAADAPLVRSATGEFPFADSSPSPPESPALLHFFPPPSPCLPLPDSSAQRPHPTGLD